jgi:elongation factor 1-beta
MADVIISMKVMPDSTEVDLEKVKEEAEILIKEFGGELGKFEIQPVAFGLNQLILIFVMDEAKGSTDQLEENVAKINGAQSVEVTDVRRAIG